MPNPHRCAREFIVSTVDPRLRNNGNIVANGERKRRERGRGLVGRSWRVSHGRAENSRNTVPLVLVHGSGTRMRRSFGFSVSASGASLVQTLPRSVRCFSARLYPLTCTNYRAEILLAFARPGLHTERGSRPPALCTKTSSPARRGRAAPVETPRVVHYISLD